MTSPRSLRGQHQRLDPPVTKDERGAAMLEFALIAVVLFTMLFGLIEGGLLVRARNAIDNAADDAARRGAVAGSSSKADWMILQQIKTRGALAAAKVNFVVVYKAENSLDPPSDTCRGGTSVTDVCNVYDLGAIDAPSTAFGAGDAGLDGNWPPSERGTSGGVEFLGVWIDATHEGVTGFFGDVDMQARSGQVVEGTFR